MYYGHVYLVRLERIGKYAETPLGRLGTLLPGGMWPLLKLNVDTWSLLLHGSLIF